MTTPIKILLFLSLVKHYQGGKLEELLAEVESRQANLNLQFKGMNDLLSQKILEHLENLKPTIIKGSPELDFPAMDPLHIPYFSFRPGKMGLVETKVCRVRDVSMYGLTNYKVDFFTVDLVKQLINLKFDFPLVTVRGLYQIDGTVINQLRIAGSGPFTLVANMTNARSSLQMIAVNGKLQIHKMGFELNPTVSFATQFQNLQAMMVGPVQAEKILEASVGFGFDNQKKFIWKWLNNTIHPFLNKFLYPMDLDAILGNKTIGN